MLISTFPNAPKETTDQTKEKAAFVQNITKL